jgi:hypothetical protein
MLMEDWQAVSCAAQWTGAECWYVTNPCERLSSKEAVIWVVGAMQWLAARCTGSCTAACCSDLVFCGGSFTLQQSETKYKIHLVVTYGCLTWYECYCCVLYEASCSILWGKLIILLLGESTIPCVLWASSE